MESFESGFFDLISKRHSIRAYKESKIDKESIEKILKAAQRAPSAGNLQSYKIFVITNNQIKLDLVKAAHDQSYIKDCSLVLVFCADPENSAKEYGSRGEQIFSVQDATLACAYSQLASQALGFSSLWVGAFDEDQVRNIVGCGKLKPVSILLIGNADENPEITERKPIQEIIQEL